MARFGSLDVSFVLRSVRENVKSSWKADGRFDFGGGRFCVLEALQISLAF